MNARLGSLGFILKEMGHSPGGFWFFKVFLEGAGEDSYDMLKHQLQGCYNSLSPENNNNGLNKE